MTAHTPETDRDAFHVPFPVVHDGVRAEQTLTIHVSPRELFRYWRDFSNLPKFIRHLERVDIIDAKRSHWIWATIGGIEIEWDSEVIAETEAKMISWQSLPGADVPNAGSVWFLPAKSGNGTDVHWQVAYNPPAGKFGETIARFLGENPARTMAEDLERLRVIMELSKETQKYNQSI